MQHKFSNLIFATGNVNKLVEVEAMLADHGMDKVFRMQTLQDIGCHEDIPETADSIVGNALMKAQYVLEHYGRPCFAEDTGLIVNALGGDPGIYSARYAGPQRNADDNMNLLLQNLKAFGDRTAYFETVIALVTPDETHCFTGQAHGTITFEKKGMDGFGYDPIFRPDGYDQTFAELKEEKNSISHRYQAMQAFMAFLKQSHPMIEKENEPK